MIVSKLSGVSSSTLDANAVPTDNTVAKKVPNLMMSAEARTKMEMKVERKKGRGRVDGGSQEPLSLSEAENRSTWSSLSLLM